MAECFWTDLIGCEQELCGAGTAALFCIGEVALTADLTDIYGVMLAPADYLYDCGDDQFSPPVPLAIVTTAKVVGVSAYTWPHPHGFCGADYKVKLACGADVYADNGGYIAGPADAPYAVQYAGDLPDRPVLALNGFGNYGLTGNALHDLESAALATFGSPAVYSFKFAVETNFGTHDWWVFRTDCY